MFFPQVNKTTGSKTASHSDFRGAIWGYPWKVLLTPFPPGLVMMFSNSCGLHNLRATHYPLHSKKPMLCLPRNHIWKYQSTKTPWFPGFNLHHNFRLYGDECANVENNFVYHTSYRGVSLNKYSRA